MSRSVASRAACRLAAAVALIGLVFSIAGLRPAAAQTTKSFQLASLEIHATVNADASMTVTEVVEYVYTGGPFTFATRSFQPAWRNVIQDFAVEENGTSLPVTPPSASASGEWQWTYPPVVGGSHRYTLTYRVPGAIGLGSDVGELYWQFIGLDHPGVGAMSVKVRVPGEYPVALPNTTDDDGTVIRAWAHGPKNGAVTPLSQGADLLVTGVPARTFVEARVAIPLAAFTSRGADPRLPTILREEKGYLEQGQTGRNAARFFAPLVSLAGLLGFGALWRKHGKEPVKPHYIGDYWREPLTDPPAVVTATMNFGTVDGKALASTLVDLAQRGHLTISEERIERFGPDKDLYRFTATTPRPRVGHALPAPLSAWESDLLGVVFQGQTEATSDDFRAWARRNQSTSALFWKGWQESVAKQMRALGYVQGGRPGVWIRALGIVVGLGLAGLVLQSITKDRAGHASPWGLLCLGSSVLVAAMMPTLRQRTDVGTERFHQAKALKKYLEDFSNLKEAPVDSLVIWERFLVYAVSLGVASHVIQGLSVKLPDVVNSPGFAPWWIPIGGSGGLGRSMDSFPGTWGSEATSAMTPQNTSSGSGGGFSGGGGGGGGGGGFGAG